MGLLICLHSKFVDLRRTFEKVKLRLLAHVKRPTVKLSPKSKFTFVSNNRLFERDRANFPKIFWRDVFSKFLDFARDRRWGDNF